MEDKIITFDTAKLAKEKGFVVPVMHSWDDRGSIDVPRLRWKGRVKDFNTELQDISILSAPTQSLLQKWLREEHKTHVEIGSELLYITAFEKFRAWYYYIDEKRIDIPQDSYEEALEKGLQEGLRLIN